MATDAGAAEGAELTPAASPTNINATMHQRRMAGASGSRMPVPLLCGRVMERALAFRARHFCSGPVLSACDPSTLPAQGPIEVHQHRLFRWRSRSDARRRALL